MFFYKISFINQEDEEQTDYGIIKANSYLEATARLTGQEGYTNDTEICTMSLMADDDNVLTKDDIECNFKILDH